MITTFSFPAAGAVEIPAGEAILNHDLAVFDQRGTTLIVGTVLTDAGKLFALVADPDSLEIKYEWQAVSPPTLGEGETLRSVKVTTYDARRKDMVVLLTVRSSTGRIFYRFWAFGGAGSSPWVSLPMPPTV